MERQTQNHGPIALGAAVFAALAIWFSLPQAPVAARGSEPGAPPSRPGPEWQGVNSCASMACHNANGPTGSKGSEYTTWILKDRHATAYLVLADERSAIIERNLRGPGKRAEEDRLCLKCHSMDTPAEVPQSVLMDGVGCESCHGAAEKWISLHYQADWKNKTDKEKLDLGMQPTKNLVYRAKMCTECHVGAAGKEVNHDLIAAGHPRMNFEFGAFQAVMPKHWDDSREKAEYPDWEARSWALGQAVSAKAALDLLAHRASTATAPWPEFSEYDCFACHHDLKATSWRQERNAQGQVLGAFLWGSWYMPLLPKALGNLDGASNVTSAEQELDKLMRQPYPDRKQVATRAQSLSQQLDKAIERRSRERFDRAALQRLSTSIATDDAKLAEQSWDGAAQVYLALAALYHASGDVTPGWRDAELRSAIKDLAKDLEFSVPAARTAQFDSPGVYETKKIGDKLKAIQQRIGH